VNLSIWYGSWSANCCPYKWAMYHSTAYVMKVVLGFPDLSKTAYIFSAVSLGSLKLIPTASAFFIFFIFLYFFSPFGGELK